LAGITLAIHFCQMQSGDWKSFLLREAASIYIESNLYHPLDQE